MTPTQFLTHILPSEGTKIGLSMNGSYRRQKAFHTCEELAAWLIGEDRRGHSVYHACATFTPNTNRKAENALAVKAFWQDVDVGEGKPYATWQDAARAVADFCTAVKLPAPLTILSGMGLHIYWVLTSPITPIEWKRVADALAGAAAAVGFAVDPTRATDISSILRPPGTMHRKGEAKQVRVLVNAAPVPLSVFDSLATKPPARVGHIGKITLGGSENGPPADAALIVKHCAQVAYIVGNQARASEPEWYAAIGLLPFCENGDALAHDWSREHPGYDPAATDKKLVHAKELGKPSLCTRFEALAPDRCAGCPARGKVSTPLELGRIKSVAQAHGEMLPPLPLDFAWSASGGLVVNVLNKANLPTQIKVTSYPVFLLEVHVAENEDGRFGYTIKYYLPREGWRTCVMRPSDLFGSAGMGLLADRAITIHQPDLFRRYMREAVDNYHATRKVSVEFDQFGWKEDKHFLLGHKLYTPQGMEDAPMSDEVRWRGTRMGPASGGSLAGWLEATRPLGMLGAETQSFAILCSFAAVLMRFADTTEGGAILSLVSHGSGRGKSLALSAAASVWGPLEALQIKSEDTRVSRGITLATLCNLPVMFDELATREPLEMEEFVKIMSSGADKARGAKSGGLNHQSGRWQTLLIAAGNVSVIDTIKAIGGSEAQSLRVLELEATLPPGAKLAVGDSMKRAMEANAGHAGHLFMARLVHPPTLAWAKQAIAAEKSRIERSGAFRTEHRFWVRMLACAKVAGAIAKVAEVLPFDPERICRYALEDMLKRLPNRGTGPVRVEGPEGSEGAEATEALQEEDPNPENAASLQALGEFLVERHSEIATVKGPFSRSASPNDTILNMLYRPQRAIVGRYERTGGRLFIVEKALRAHLVKRNIGFNTFIQSLVAQGVIVAHSRMIGITQGTEIMGAPLPCVELDGLHPALSGSLRAVERDHTRVLLKEGRPR